MLDRAGLGRWMLFIVTKMDVRCLLIYVFNCVPLGESIRSYSPCVNSPCRVLPPMFNSGM